MIDTTTPSPAPEVEADASPAAAPAPAPAPKRWTRFITPALALVAALVVGGVAGVLIGQNTATRGPAVMGPGGFVTDGDGPQLQGSGPGADITAGTIQSIDGDTITVELPDGTTVTVTADDDTTVTQTSDAEVSDLAEGDEITVIGETDADGNVAADAISEGGALRFGGPVTSETPAG